MTSALGHLTKRKELMEKRLRGFRSLWTGYSKFISVYLDVAAGVGPGDTGTEGGASPPHVERLAGAPPRSGGGGVAHALRVGIPPGAVGVALAQVPALFTPVGNAY